MDPIVYHSIIGVIIKFTVKMLVTKLSVRVERELPKKGYVMGTLTVPMVKMNLDALVLLIFFNMEYQIMERNFSVYSEIFLTDCPKSAFSCNNFIAPESCIPLNKRCDGKIDCASEADEKECTALYFGIHGNGSYYIPQTSGFLHRNWKGEWFPVCVDLFNDNWAKEACQADLGYLPQ